MTARETHVKRDTEREYEYLTPRSPFGNPLCPCLPSPQPLFRLSSSLCVSVLPSLSLSPPTFEYCVSPTGHPFLSLPHPSPVLDTHPPCTYTSLLQRGSSQPLGEGFSTWAPPALGPDDSLLWEGVLCFVRHSAASPYPLQARKPLPPHQTAVRMTKNISRHCHACPGASELPWG